MMETVPSEIIFWSLSAFQRTATIICGRSVGVLRSFFTSMSSYVVRNISKSTKLTIFQSKEVIFLLYNIPLFFFTFQKFTCIFYMIKDFLWIAFHSISSLFIPIRPVRILLRTQILGNIEPKS